MSDSLDLTSWSTADLLILQESITVALADRLDDDVIGFQYDALRNAFLSKFPMERVNALSTWESLSVANQNKFKKAWSKACMFFTSKGFLANKNLYQLIIKLIVNSPYLEHNLSLLMILDSLGRIGPLFDRQFPNYLTTGAIDLIRGKLNSVR